MEVKAINGTPLNIKSVADHYKNVSFPLVLVVFDNKTDQGYFTWIKEPAKEGHLTLENNNEKLNKLNDTSLKEIVRKVKEWYAHQPATFE